MSKVKGGKDGLVFDNTYNIKGQPLIDVGTLKQNYLFGITFYDKNSNQVMPDEVFQQYIDNAISMLEHYLDISITPVKKFTEYKDYRVNDYVDWGYFRLNNFPVICIRSLKLVYFRDESGEPQVVQTIPNNWIRLQAHDGIVRLIPNARFPTNLQVSQTGAYFPEILRSQFVPHLWELTYDYGFDVGCIPVLLNEAIGRIAAIQALMIGGNLVLGAGIASSSISLDGLSQSIATTQSAENSAYSATIKENQVILFGKTKDDPNSILRILKDYYKGITMSMI